MGNGKWSDFNASQSNRGAMLFTYTPTDHSLRYPGDPALFPLAYATLPATGETIFVYPHAWVCIVQPDGEFTIDRRD